MNGGTLIQATALPRSGTAWLSVLFSLNPECLAFHDAISVFEDWRERLDAGLRTYRWVADCGTYQYLRGASRQGSIKIAIIQPAQRSQDAAAEAFGLQFVPGAFGPLASLLDDWVAAHPGTLAVPETYLWGRPTAAESIWYHAFGDDVRFPGDKVEHLRRMHVQRVDAKQAFAPDSLSRRISDLF